MKSYLKSWIGLLLAAFMAPVLLTANPSGDYYGLPGDDFSLEGALDLFKSCNSLEDFERELNSSDNTVNNLDLNNNGRIDYLRVVDHAEEGDMHAIVIQALVDNGISQDVAVIEVKRNRYGEAVVQIVGDEDLYGTAKIVEPYPYDDVVGTDYYDNYYEHYSPTVFVNAWTWPSVRFIFAPRYVMWVSPYYYGYYPGWYSPWDPYPYHVWHTRTVIYNNYYCVAPNYRIPEVHHYYGARRVSAPVVRQRTERYVAEHGGRSNFDYTKRGNAVDAPRGRSLDKSDKPTVATNTDKQRGQASKDLRPKATPQVAQPQIDRNNTRSHQPQATTPETRQHELNPRDLSPMAKPQVAQPQVTNPSANSRTQQSREQQSRTQEAAPTRPSRAESNNRQAASPKQEAAPRTNNAIDNQSHRPSAPSRIDRQAAPAPRANRTEMNSRSNTNTSSKTTNGNGAAGRSSEKSQRTQPRKG